MSRFPDSSPTSCAGSSVPAVALFAFWVGTTGVLAAQETPTSQADSVQTLEAVQERQVEFERLRERLIPPAANTGRGGCDERIGRICIWFGGEGEEDFPREPTETSLARGELIGDLLAARETIRDPWVEGQLVHYLVEAGRLADAEQVARDCGLAQGWWCSALLGYVLHVGGDVVAAEMAFREGAANVSPEEQERWRTPRFVLSSDAVEVFEEAEPAEAQRLWETFWRFSDPLFMVEGNDRLTEHFARLVVARNRESAANPYDMEWGEDLEESLIRYGRQIGWSRVRGAPPGVLGGGGNLQDTRRVVGHHHPMSRGYLFPERFLEAPADVPPESWITAPREARTWYAPPYAPDFRGLETQIARFRRGAEMLVVGAYRPSPPEQDPFASAADQQDGGGSNPFARSSGFGQADPPPEPEPDPFGNTGVDGPVRSALFLMPEAGGDPIVAEGSEAAGVFRLQAPTGRYVSSLEVFEPAEERAWRARQGVNQAELLRGLVAASDLLILSEDAPLPDDLDQAIPLARPGVRIGTGERFTVAWEVYGLDVDEEVEVTLGFTEGRPGFLTRVGEFLGVLEPAQPVEVTFSDAARGEVATLFRAVSLGLPDMEPGEYTLHLRLELPGREPAVSSRPIVVVP